MEVSPSTETAPHARSEVRPRARIFARAMRVLSGAVLIAWGIFLMVGGALTWDEHRGVAALNASGGLVAAAAGIQFLIRLGRPVPTPRVLLLFLASVFVLVSAALVLADFRAG